MVDLVLGKDSTVISRKRWEAGADAGEMIRSALHRATNPERKARLYRVALVRRVWGEVPWITRVLTELAERRADGAFDPSSLPRTLEYLAEGLLYTIQFSTHHDADGTAAVLSSSGLADYERYLLAAGHVKPPDADRAAAHVPLSRHHELAWLALGTHFEWPGPKDLSAGTGFDSVPLVRDIFGNPFRSVAFDPAWRTDTAVAVARQMYDARDFGAMPVLADALQDAGCEDEQVLTHCRDANQPHVRGCWVVDLVLGKG